MYFLAEEKEFLLKKKELILARKNRERVIKNSIIFKFVVGDILNVSF
jgi:5-formaminoimidazole-4-carboxamide-1-beta-D-ribofuranosyl 5'-monophosphate synthetase